MTTRLVMSGAAFTTFVAGYEISPEAQLGALTAILVVGIITEAATRDPEVAQ